MIIGLITKIKDLHRLTNNKNVDGVLYIKPYTYNL